MARSRATTEETKKQVLRSVLRTLNWKGAYMMWPYRDEKGRSFFAELRPEDLLKAIKFGQ